MSYTNEIRSWIGIPLHVRCVMVLYLHPRCETFIVPFDTLRTTLGLLALYGGGSEDLEELWSGRMVDLLNRALLAANPDGRLAVDVCRLMSGKSLEGLSMQWLYKKVVDWASLSVPYMLRTRTIQHTRSPHPPPFLLALLGTVLRMFEKFRSWSQVAFFPLDRAVQYFPPPLEAVPVDTILLRSFDQSVRTMFEVERFTVGTASYFRYVVKD